MQINEELQLEYKNYERQKCFVAHSLGAEWGEDIKSACATILPKFKLEPWYAADHFDPTQPLRDKVVELIANSRYGIYDISSWQDKQENWQIPRNVFIELGIAIALNRPTLLLRHSRNKNLPLPGCLQGVESVEFTGDITLKKELEQRLPQWLDVPPDRDWLNRFCIFGNRVCAFREQHPCLQQWGQKTLHCHISDGLNQKHSNYCQSECDEIQGMFEEVFSRYIDLEFTFLNEQSVVDGYQHLLCSQCQEIRSAPIAIYRISPMTSAGTFISIGISIALEKVFSYKIPKILLVRQEQDLPSLLRGYEVVEALSTRDIKQKLKAYIPDVIKLARNTNWQPKPLPFLEIQIESKYQSSLFELDYLSQSKEEIKYYKIPIEALNISSRTYNCLKRSQISSIGDLLEYSEEDLLEIRSFGSKSMFEVVQALKIVGVKLQQKRTSKSGNLEESKIDDHRKYYSNGINSLDSTPIEDLDLTVRAYNFLKRARINNVDDLMQYSQQDLLDIKNANPTSVEEIIEALQFRLGITLPTRSPDFIGNTLSDEEQNFTEQKPAEQKSIVPEQPLAPAIMAVSESEKGDLDLNGIWQLLLDHLHRPSRALFREHAQLITFRDREATIGIRNNSLARIAQSKLPDIEKAFQKVFDRKVAVSLHILDASVVKPPINPHTPL
jgi:hypothetical protein